MSTPHTYQIVPAWRESYRQPSRMIRDGWHLILDGEYAQTYRTKREARDAGRYATAQWRWRVEHS